MDDKDGRQLVTLGAGSPAQVEIDESASRLGWKISDVRNAPRGTGKWTSLKCRMRKLMAAKCSAAPGA